MIKLIKLWILASAACVSAGWILSALHQLNWAGYLVFLALSAAAMAWQFRRWDRMENTQPRNLMPRFARRFRRALPLVFLLTATLATIGGILHAPNNYDALTYRFPRVLHWWAEGTWHWIATPNLRMNLSGTGFEWLMMPIFVATHSDRFLFLINIFAFLLLPSLVFITFVALGVARRVAWFWMWLLPAALCYAMQAGSISNDTVAVTYFLAAIYFALQARRTWRLGNLWLACLSAGLLTGVKASNLPLLLPIVWAMWPAARLLSKQVAGSVAILVLGTLISFIPTALLNQRHTGDWGGDPLNVAKVQVQNPVAGILGNGLQLGLQSLEPPFLPLARSVEIWVWDQFPKRIQHILNRDFPHFGVGFRELPQEESAGVGIGITIMGIVSLIAAWRLDGLHKTGRAAWRRRQGIMIGILTWIALIVYMTKLGSEATSRLIAGYYPLLLIPIVLTPAQGILVRRKWYKIFGVGAGLIALMAVILTPSRPLWPAKSFFDWALERFPKNAVLQHGSMVYRVYRGRNDLLVSMRHRIPGQITLVGLIEGSDDPETSLWRPYGLRRVVHVPGVEKVTTAGVPWLVVKNNILGLDKPGEFDEWLRRTGGVLVARESITEKANAGPEEWCLLHFPGLSN